MKQSILLLGNGIDRAYNSHGISWGQLLDKMTTNEDLPPHEPLPFPLELVLRTNDHVDEVLKLHHKELYSNVEDEELRNTITNLLDLGFTEILTTNYDYAIEETEIHPQKIQDKHLKQMIEHTSRVKRPENKYYLHTFNLIQHNDKPHRIWHIHGEARKPDSIVIGHYSYVNLVSKWRDEIKKYEGKYKEFDHSMPADSWIDSFILGNVYILGLGMDFCELDLWWLINRKKREKQPHGKIIFYEPESSGSAAKYALLKAYDVDVRHLGFKLIQNNDEEASADEDNSEYQKEQDRIRQFNGTIYKDFYPAAMADIKKEMAKE